MGEKRCEVSEALGLLAGLLAGLPAGLPLGLPAFLSVDEAPVALGLPKPPDLPPGLPGDLGDLVRGLGVAAGADASALAGASFFGNDLAGDGRAAGAASLRGGLPSVSFRNGLSDCGRG